MHDGMNAGPNAAEKKALNSARCGGTLSFRIIVSTLIRRIRAVLLRLKDYSAKAARSLGDVKISEATESECNGKPRRSPLSKSASTPFEARRMPKVTPRNEASPDQMNANLYARTLADELAKRELSEVNVNRLHGLIQIASDPKVAKLLNDCKVASKRFVRALYASEKCIHLALALTREAPEEMVLSAVVEASLKTILLCSDAGKQLLKSDIEAALLINHEPEKGREMLVHKKRKPIKTPAQVQQSLDMGITLGFLQQQAKDTYRIVPNAILELAREKLAGKR